MHFHGSLFENYRTSGFNAADQVYSGDERRARQPAGISLVAASAARSLRISCFFLGRLPGDAE